MKLKRFSDFSDKEEIVEEVTQEITEEVKENEDVILEKEEKDNKEIDLEEKTGEEPEETEEEKDDDKTPVSKNEPTEKEEKVDENFEIEILEDNIIKFNNGHVKKIYELLNEKYSDTHYFIRKKDNQLHIVKYNENLTLNVNNFVDSLFKFYSTSKELKPLTQNIKIKGNDKFSVIENINPHAFDRIVNDLSKLLSKKK